MELLGDVIARLRALDELTESTPTHRLERFTPLIDRLESIREDLCSDTRMRPAMRKTSELNARLSGGFSRLDDPKYRSLLGSLLGQYQRRTKPSKAYLGGLKGGRPRKDGKPTRTLESKGYTAETLPTAKKEKKVRVHPTLNETRNDQSE